MKKLFLTAVLLLVSLPLISKGDPKLMHLTKPHKLSDIQDRSETECDLCGCYMGLEPNFNDNQIGLRYYTFKFFTEGHPASSTDNLANRNANPLNEVDHA